MTNGCARFVFATGEACNTSAKRRASARILFIFQLVPIQGILRSMVNP